MTDTMAQMHVPQHYAELLPSGRRSLIMVEHYALRCIVADDDGRVIFDWRVEAWWNPLAIASVMEMMRRA